MKQSFAFLASMLIVSSCMALPVSATWQEVVIAVNDDSSKWVTEDKQTYYYRESNDIATFNPSQEIFGFGDIIEFENISMSVTELNVSCTDDSGMIWKEDTVGSGNCCFMSVDKEDQSYSITKIGSVFDNPETAQFTVVEKCDRDKLILADDEGNQYNYNIDWLNHGYYQPDCIDLTSLHSGDVISCITYNDSPMLAKEIISSAPPSGDANGDGTLNILDVIIVNQAILGKKRLTDTDKIYHVDFNQNGVPDAADSLTMLKMIVELE